MNKTIKDNLLTFFLITVIFGGVLYSVKTSLKTENDLIHLKENQDIQLSKIKKLSVMFLDFKREKGTLTKENLNAVYQSIDVKDLQMVQKGSSCSSNSQGFNRPSYDCEIKALQVDYLKLSEKINRINASQIEQRPLNKSSKNTIEQK